MPSNEILLAMPNLTVFKTKGYYNPNDGNGGYYVISYGISNGKYIGLHNGNYVFLVALDENANYYGASPKTERINVCRYGVRSVDVSLQSATKENTYAVENSNIIENLLMRGSHRKALYFPIGKFYFERTINLGIIDDQHSSASQNSLYGEFSPQVLSPQAAGMDGTYKGGSVLLFPWLDDEHPVAIRTSAGNVANIQVVGNPNTYNISFTRGNLKTDPNTVMSETIAEEDGVQVLRTGLKNDASIATIRNVNVAFFYKAFDFGGTNTYMENLYVNKCHYGLLMGADIQCDRINGWNVHTLVQIKSGSNSLSNVRVDSCYTPLNVLSSTGAVVNNLNGDFCMSSMVIIGDGVDYHTIDGLSITNIRGRCSALKSYYDGSDPNISNGNSKYASIESINIDNTNHYGFIRVMGKTVLTNSDFLVNGVGGGNILDTEDDPDRVWKYPRCLYTFAGNVSIFKNNMFRVIKGLDGTREDLKKIVPLWYDRNNTISCANATFILKNNKRIVKIVDEDEVAEMTVEKTSTLPAAHKNVGKMYIYSGATDGTYYKGCEYESVATEVTPEEGDNPQTNGWYELNGTTYTASTDTSVVSGKTYYSISWVQLTVSVEQLPS